ncbi:MAG: hypothetical protein EAZ42_02970 [Verrucomicrobia bacterium]|nr:MAG: hypothetical protein EAZ42_02970 [Verrucomicrobiota bacterium]
MDPALIMHQAFWRDAMPIWLGVDEPPCDFAGEELQSCVMFQTSGSSGRPKWVALKKTALLHSAAAVNAHLRVNSQSRWALALPIHHVGGFGVACRAYLTGAQLAVFQQRWQPRAFADWLDAEKSTHTSLVPTQIHDLVVQQITAPASLNAVVVGGGLLDSATGQAARELGWPVLASYGMTEAASQIATQSIDALEKIYQPFPLRVLPHWKVETNHEMRISIGGPALFHGFVEIDSSGDIHFAPAGPLYLTQDCGDFSNNQFFSITRTDACVKILGELLDPRQIEQKLAAWANVNAPSSSWAVIPLPDRRTGHRLALAYEAPIAEEHIANLLEKYNAQATGYARIHQSIRLDRLPRVGALGKISYSQLIAQCEALSAE